ncbi:MULTISPECIES: PucR family transcriptional regulator [Bartonella]|uniref:PucR family transcriptional regulator n=1 Tax=Bartonella TaxID=773 RepID=UPI0018DC5D03|nr:PucR family transcriptional regulator ligand-binding domain-containing protein [Bartonella choladocola]MBI0014057.1 PucR family transcriptional regulator ligand-binding domain-containing protein [Bartonella sp. B10834G3]
MVLTVEDLCQMTEPAIIPVAGKTRLKNKINWVIATDHPNPKQWIRGGEFNLICGCNLKDNPVELVSYIDRLYSCGISGIGFGIGLKFDKIPQIIIERANALQLPVCEVPYELSFSRISQIAAENIINEQLKKNKRLLESRVIEDAIDGRLTIYDIAMRISSTLVCDTRFISHDDTIIAQVLCGQGPIKANYINEILDRRAVFSCTPTVKLEIIRQVDSLSATETAFISKMLLAARIILTRQDAVARERAQLSIDLLSEIYAGQNKPKDLMRKFAILGFALNAKYRIIVIRSSSGILDETFQILRKTLPQHMLIGFENDNGVVLIPEETKDNKVNFLLSTLCTRLPDVTIGVSSPCEIKDLSAAVNQAKALSKIKEPGLKYPDNMNIESLLKSLDPVILQNYVTTLFTKKLTRELRETIEILLDCGFNIKQAAEKLGVHRHTIRIRIDRFCDVTGVDIKIAENRNKIWFLLKLAKTLDDSAN